MSTELTLPIKTLWAFAKWLPGFLVRRSFPATRLADLVYVDIRPRHDPVTLDLGQCGRFELWLLVLNLSPFDVELDRASFSFRCAGAQLDAAILDKQTIRSGAQTSIRVHGSIPDGYADHLAKSSAAPLQYDARLQGNIEFNCWVRPFARVIGSLDGINPRIINASYRQAVGA